VADEFVTRREMDIFRAESNEVHKDIRSEIRELDNHGTRGVLQLSIQVTDLTKSVAKFDEKLEHHEGQHVEERKDRTKSRRWIITTSIALLSVGGTLIYMMFDVLQHVH